MKVYSDDKVLEYRHFTHEEIRGILNFECEWHYEQFCNIAADIVEQLLDEIEEAIKMREASGASTGSAEAVKDSILVISKEDSDGAISG